MKEDICNKCNSQLKLTLMENSIHYGRLDCPQCGFKGYARNPLSPKNNTTAKLRTGKKEIKDVCEFHNFKKELCFFCLRTRNELGNKETLTNDHIIELSEGGEDKLENMQVLCSACHKLKNWARLYLHWHLKKENKGDDTNTKTVAE
jgi:5-methylcytosine-specific restriction endonuclease McrA